MIFSLFLQLVVNDQLSHVNKIYFPEGDVTNGIFSSYLQKSNTFILFFWQSFLELLVFMHYQDSIIHLCDLVKECGKDRNV